jgi:3-methyladenine DNA glycosylase AlkD
MIQRLVGLAPRGTTRRRESEKEDAAGTNTCAAQTQRRRLNMTADEIVEQLRPLGRDSYKNVLLNHGIREPLFGVKIEDLKKFQKRIKKDYQLALDLYDTGIYDAMYLAGLIADDARMTKKDLRHWIEKANCPMHCEYTVPWVAAGSPHGWELALEWIDSGKEIAAAAGWATLGSLVAIKDDADLELQKTIHQ